ncbi:MAG: recombination mediator RecR [Patescibacteria group bacterium]|nr:recombination mediator RecR [Patescibacteria group bacterium]
MPHYPRSILELIAQFTRLPGIGPKTAERLALYLASRPPADADALARAAAALHAELVKCKICGDYAETDPCGICRDQSRDPAILCVVAKPQDLLALERTGEFRGRYHVLGGTANPLEGVTLEHLNVSALRDRIKRDSVREVILAFNPDVAGEHTALAVRNVLSALAVSPPLKITKLARGLPLGSDVEYADEVTLGHALRGRRPV